MLSQEDLRAAAGKILFAVSEENEQLDLAALVNRLKGSEPEDRVRLVTWDLVAACRLVITSNWKLKMPEIKVSEVAGE